MKPPASIVIVGAGQAGSMAAVALRAQGFEGRLTLLGREIHAPYERPPLSKDVLCAIDEPATRIHPDGLYQSQAIEWQAGVDAIALDRANREVGLSDGRRVGYDRCLLATGGDARELPGLPRGTAGVHYLRTLEDARRLRSALTPGRRVVVIGGGFLGLELASSARARQATVEMLETAPRLLERFMPPAGSAWLAARARRAGIGLHLGVRLQGAHDIDLATGALQIARDDAPPLEADVVVVAVGLAPDTRLARQAGLEIDPSNGGIRVDEQCRSSDPAVFAAGDCASQHRAATGSHIRFESWQNANVQGGCAAAGMLGLAPPAASYPWFWTDQFNCNIQMLGLPATGLSYTVRGDLEAAEARLIWLGHRKGVPIHAIAVNAGGDLRLMRSLFEAGLPLDPTAFADTTIPLRGQVKAAQQRAS